MREKRLPQRVVFVELVGGKGYSEGQEKNWLVHLKEEDMWVFGMEFEAWRETAQNAGRRFDGVGDGAELFMREWHEMERRRAAEGYSSASE